MEINRDELPVNPVSVTMADIGSKKTVRLNCALQADKTSLFPETDCNNFLSPKICTDRVKLKICLHIMNVH